MNPSPGRTWPLGATLDEGGTNFCVWSRHASSVDLELYDHVDAIRPSRVIRLDPERHSTYHYWHVHVPGVRAGQLYGWRVHGMYDPDRGYRFRGDKLLLDPYGRGVAVPAGYDRLAATRPGDNAASAMKSVVVDLSAYDWEGDQPLRRHHRGIIYELHVRGFTRHESSGVAPERRGTYAGLVDKIPYLRDLGVTTVELMPVFQFDPQDAPPGRTNYWGYSPVSFFAPHLGYATSSDPLRAIDEFRDMVKALHRAGLEVILDVVFNHTAEGDDTGPTLCFRGLDNRAYYITEANGRGYANYAGCGNTLKANHPVVRRLILDSLRHWVSEMHVDGFRFDLASVLSRDLDGNPVPNAPILWDIESDPVLCGSKLIAEAWDAAGLYQVGHFVGNAWWEWNGKFRDDVRSFMRGDGGTVSRFANRLLASPDLFERDEREAEQSVNFVTCHDGFTLNDLVTYSRKHNLANGELDRDGASDNHSWNCGVEGPSDDPSVEALRGRQIRNFVALNLLSAGIPMLLMGDEMRRTQRGNNNAWCQDNEVSWLDWSLLERHADLHGFVRRLVQLRLRVQPGRRRAVSLTAFLRRARIEWHGVKLGQPDWGPDSHSLAVRFRSHFTGAQAFLAVNAWKHPLDFELPPAPGGWRPVVDTYRAPPREVLDWDEVEAVTSGTYTVGPHSLVLLGAENHLEASGPKAEGTSYLPPAPPPFP